MKKQESSAAIRKEDIISIQWRRHEMILVTASAVMLAAGYLWNIHTTPITNFSKVFSDNNVPFELYTNVVFPTVGMGILVYLAYLWLSVYSIPHILFSKSPKTVSYKTAVSFNKISIKELVKKAIKNYTWLVVQIILLIGILGTTLNAANYLKQQWQFNYPGFSIFFNKNIPQSQLDIGGGYFAMASIVFFYAVYICIREILIRLVQSSRQQEYNTMLCNRITAFILLFLSVPVFLRSFNIAVPEQFYVSYFLIVPALFAMFISNVYTVFPMMGDDGLFSKKITGRILITSCIYAAPLTVFIHETGPLAFVYSWALQLFVVTPLTWWYYQSNKDSILQLRVVQKQLVRSKADLQFLRSQINPHFLFNALNTLYGTALQEDAGRTAEGIQRLGDMMRFMLEENNMDFIQMEKEIEYLNHYIVLQKLRLQASPEIIIENNINEQDCHHRIAPMLLIPLVENAFKHGISLNEKSWITIKLSCTATKISFEVRNSIHVKKSGDPEDKRSGIGLNNVLERLKLIYPGKHEIKVNDNGKEFTVQLSIEPS